MNSHEAESFLLSLANLPRAEYMNDPNACETYLKRMQYFLDLLGNPEKQIPHYIHVTGTSGKGSVTTYLEQILLAAGKKVGATISPHPTRLTERWRVGGKEMTEKEFIQIATKFKPILDKYIQTSPYDMVSYFEITTAMAFYYFAKKKVEWAVIEVGLGGRYDSTNIIPHADIVVITNIGLDHTELLGDKKTDIAYEKAGIIKPNSTVFTSETQKNIQQLFQQEIKNVGAESLIRSPQEKPTITSISLSGQTFSYQGTAYQIKASGVHQATNATLSIDIAKHLHISSKAIKQGLKNTIQPLRMEVVAKNPTIILDGAHNPDKITSTIQTTNALNSKQHPIHLVLGFSNDKDISTMLKKLTTLNPTSIACTRNTNNPFRKVHDPKALQRQIDILLPDCRTEVFLDPINALKWSKEQAQKSDIILVTGSIFLSGEIRGNML